MRGSTMKGGDCTAFFITRSFLLQYDVKTSCVKRERTFQWCQLLRILQAPQPPPGETFSPIHTYISTAAASFIPPTLSYRPTCSPHSLSAYKRPAFFSISVIVIVTITIITMQAPRLLDVRFKADDSDSDHHSHRTHTSVYLSFPFFSF